MLCTGCFVVFATAFAGKPKQRLRILSVEPLKGYGSTYRVEKDLDEAPTSVRHGLQTALAYCRDGHLGRRLRRSRRTRPITFKGASEGEIVFGAVKGWLDVRYGTRDGSACAEFSWQGNDEGDPVCGRGWVALGTAGRLVGHIDRLSRRMADIHDLHDNLEVARIALHCPGVGEMTIMHITVMGLFAQLYLKELAKKTKRGQTGRAAAGKVAGGLAWLSRLACSQKRQGVRGW